jgi:cysteine desulfurase
MIYLDHHATTAVDARVLEAMLPYFSEKFGNPASKHHRFGWEANEAVEKARKQVAQLIGAGSKDVIFTSGGTEANNLAIKGAARARQADRNQLVTVTTEHKAVLDPMARLGREGFRFTPIPVDAGGRIELNVLDRVVTDRTALVSVMAANNEIGVLQPIKDAAAIAHRHGAWFHTDAVQAAGRVPFDVEELDVDFATISAHKIYGPKGIGALYVRRRSASLTEGNRVSIAGEIDGGGHERGLRSGTLNVPAIVGFGRAAEIARAEMESEAKRIGELRDRLLAGLQARVDGMTVNGALDRRLPGNLNVSFAGVDGEALLVSLDDIAVSSGAACTQAEPSHVLMALGMKTHQALASLRFGIGRSTTAEDVDYTARKVSDVVARLRQLSPVAEGLRA